MQATHTGTADTLPRFAVPLDENAFVDWLVDAKPGERTVYYRGHLGHDRAGDGRLQDRHARSNLNAVASRVMTAAEQGLVHPVQKKIGREDFLYFAVRASDRRAGSDAARIPLSRFAPPVAVEVEAVAA